MQCGRRAHLDSRLRRGPAPVDDNQQSMIDVGKRLVEIARMAFPTGQHLGDLPLDEAVEQTQALLTESSSAILFDAAFATDDVAIRADIVLGAGSGRIDLFEVKAGAKVKLRHLQDIALQMYTVESGEFDVNKATILHLNSQYRHRGDNVGSYPVHTLFKSIEVTGKARRHLDRVHDSVQRFQSIIAASEPLDVPVGTQCTDPVVCPHFAKCAKDGPAHPLTSVPELRSEQEQAWHEQGIEEVEGLDPASRDLSPLQRRAIRAIQTDATIIEPFVANDARDVPRPVFLVEFANSLQVLPKYDGDRPWTHIPFAWSVSLIGQDAITETKSFVAIGKEDPRNEFADTLIQALDGAGSLIGYGPGIETRLRDLLDGSVDDKRGIRAMLSQGVLDLQLLLKDGVYAPNQRGSFDLAKVHEALRPDSELESADTDIVDNGSAARAFERLLTSRVRQVTRDKVRKSIGAWLEHRSELMAELYLHLRTSTGTSDPSD